MQKIKWNHHTLSKLCLGTVQFGIDYGIANTNGQVPQSTVNEILDYVIFEGLNCFDTAKNYGNSELVIGNYLKKSPFKDTVQIISKMKSRQLFLDYQKLNQEIKQSLDFLSKEKLFGLLLHDSEVSQKWNQDFSNIISKLKSDGIIEFFGVSIYTDEEFNLALNNEDIEIIQIPFSLLDQRAIHKKWLQRANAKNKLIFIRSIYLQGLILMNSDDLPLGLENAKPYIDEIERVCQDIQISRNELALSFVNSLAPDSVILFGCDNLNQAKENINNFKSLIKLNQDVIEYLLEQFSSIDEKIYNPTKWNTK